MAMDELVEPFIKQNNSYKGWLNSYKMEIPPFIIRRDLRLFLQEIEGELIRIIRDEAEALRSLKFSFTMQIELIKNTNRGEEKVKYYTRQVNPTILNAFSTQKAKEKLKAELDKIIERLANWVENGSGWAVDRIGKAYLDFSRYNPLRGGAYLPLPSGLQSKM